MKYIHYPLLILSFALTSKLFSQPNPAPKLETKAGDAIGIDKYNVEVSVVGNLATTTCEMFFYNKENRVLEGELVFPLGENQTVSRFAMEVNGKLREGVPVEKNKGRQVFETIERRRVDPGLLEQVQGNTFKARIYPIPARGYKHVVIAYQQELENTAAARLYELPLFLDQVVKEFSIKVNVFKQYSKPEIVNNIDGNLRFEKWSENYTAGAKYNDITLNHVFKISLPKEAEKIPVFVEKGIHTNEGYFYIEIPVNGEDRPKKYPGSVSIYWDASSSGQKRDVEKETEFLNAYLKALNNAKIELVVFANDILSKNTYELINGNCQMLFSKIKSIQFDGGTQLGKLDFSTCNSKEILLFTDGLGTYGKQGLKLPKTPVITINSSPQADPSLLQYIARATGGTYVNLLKQSIEQAIQWVTNQNFQFISAEYPHEVRDFYPSMPARVNNNFTCAGILNAGKAKVKLNFGYGDEVVLTKTIDINAGTEINSGMVERIWAQKKLFELDMQYEKNKNEISGHGKKYSLVTRNTSLIVLETVEDYLQYEIYPPVELAGEYNKRLKERNNEKLDIEKEAIENAVRLYSEKINWWKRDFKPIEVKPSANDRRNIEDPVIPSREYSNVHKTVTGKVVDENNGPLPGASVVLRGTTTGTVTDADGNFTINIPDNGVLHIQYIGYVSREIDATGINNATIAIEPDFTGLDEVVVGYGASRGRSRNRNLDIVANESFLVSDMVSEEVQMDMAPVSKKTESINVPLKGTIYLKPWDPESPYLKKLEGIKDDVLYAKYMELRYEYKDVPSFYADISEYFYKKGLKKEAIRIVSNLAEMQLLNHELLRVLAHRLEQMGEYDAAIEVYKKVKEIRAEEPQSFRDLALVHEKNKDYQLAADIMYSSLKRSWDGRFPGIEAIMVSELNAIIFKAGDRINTNGYDKRLMVNLPVDIRVVLNWDADNTDMDLWVTDPNNEKCFYSHKLTQLGGNMSNDFTGGYGPEEFMLRKAKDGKYLIQANYYGSSQQKISGPVTIYLQLFLNYGKAGHELKEITLRLKDNKEVVDIGEFEFGK